MTDNLGKIIDKRARDFARVVEDAGDFIGPNDMALANTLWAASERLRRYGKERLNRD